MKKVDKYVKKLDTDSSFQFQKQLGYTVILILKFNYLLKVRGKRTKSHRENVIAFLLIDFECMTSELMTKSAERKPNKKRSSKTDY